MIVDKNILQAYSIFDNLPSKFQSLGENEKYVFYYTYDEDALKLNVVDDDVKKDINIILFQDLDNKKNKYRNVLLKLGFLSFKNDTRDGLFYLFLRTYNDPAIIDAFYEYTKAKDEEVDLSVSIEASNEIFDYADFSRAVSYFCKYRVNSVMLIYNMVDAAFKRNFDKSLYGNYLRKVVNLVKYEAGVLLEEGGELRYMVVGEKAQLNDQQKNSLQEAKLLLRSQKDTQDIYLKTGWGFLAQDGLWRTNISDANAKLSENYIIDYGGGKLYVPKGNNPKQVAALVMSPEKIYNGLYYGVLSDLLEHDTLYKYYPMLAYMPIMYYANANLPSDINRFYHFPDDRGGYILMRGNYEWGNHLSILLHEVQHIIQDIEGFARGGNQRIAEFVSSVGSESVRKIFSSIKAMEKYFMQTFSDNLMRDELLLKVKNYSPKSSTGDAYKKYVLEYLNDTQSFDKNKSTINYFLTFLIASDGDITDSEIVSYLLSVFPAEKLLLYDLFDNILEGNEQANKWREVLKAQGIPDNVIPSVLHSNYENLYGEVESRSVQATRTLGGTFRNYFYLTSWEKSPNDKVTVIDDKPFILDVKDLKAAIETKNGEYVLHFQRSQNSIPFLHELGHIVHDGIKKVGRGDTISNAFLKQQSIVDVNEYFVGQFLAYIKKNVDDDDLNKDLRLHFVFLDDDISELLDDFLRYFTLQTSLEVINAVLDA